jgi:ribosomal protein L37AE/L43A
MTNQKPTCAYCGKTVAVRQREGIWCCPKNDCLIQLANATIDPKKEQKAIVFRF